MDWSNFESVFKSKADYAPDQKLAETISKNRKELGGTLFFDRIWFSIGLKQPQKSYPPKSNAELRSLWQKLVKAEVSDEKKQALLFYILKDCKQLSNLDVSFAQKAYLPLKYQILVSGLWELDHLQFPRALEQLTDPYLTPEFADDILLVLLQHPKCDDTLAMAYFLTVRPPLAKQECLEAYFELLVETDIVEAYHFCRKMDSSRHKALFEELLRTVHEEPPSPKKVERLMALVSLAFTTEEEHWFEDYLSKGQGSRIHGAKDSVLLRRLAISGSLSGPGIPDRHRGPKLNEVNWDNVRTLTKAATT